MFAKQNLTNWFVPKVGTKHKCLCWKIYILSWNNALTPQKMPLSPQTQNQYESKYKFIKKKHTLSGCPSLGSGSVDPLARTPSPPSPFSAARPWFVTHFCVFCSCSTFLFSCLYFFRGVCAKGVKQDEMKPPLNAPATLHFIYIFHFFLHSVLLPVFCLFLFFVLYFWVFFMPLAIFSRVLSKGILIFWVGIYIDVVIFGGFGKYFS